MYKKNIDFFSLSKKGLHKINNEDATLVINESAFSLFIIFDGVGSALNAKKATFICKKFIKNNYQKYVDTPQRLSNLLFELNNYLLKNILDQLYTTYSLLYVPEDSDNLYFSSLGDSRLYKMNNQFLEQISIDDSYSSNVITKCLGLEYYDLAIFDMNTFKKENFSYLLCTDGFYNLMEKDKIIYFEIFNKKRLGPIKRAIQKKIGNNNNDDATLIFIKNTCLDQSNN